MAATLRPQPGQDTRAWTRDVFDAGDYAGASMFGDAATWQCHAARALVRGDEASFAALADFADTAARFHAAAARFVHGDTARARRELTGLDLPHARNLAAMLDRGRIRVLAQLPWLPGAMTDLVAGARHDGLFDLRQISHRNSDVPNRPYLEVAPLAASFAPDFYVAAMVEWHHLPPDLQALPCPRFGHIADHDLHIQTIRPWLDLFDELCVTDRSEWLDVQGLGRGSVSSFPKVFGLPMGLPPLTDAERHLDFFVSGTMLDPYHPDKARVLHELLAMPDITMRVVKGFMGSLAFHALLAASKVSFTYVRRPGAMPTRGLESLALGCAVALQEESILNLWVGEHEGIVTYGAAPGALAKAVRQVRDDWARFRRGAQRGAAAVREHFAMPRVASQYLRFLAFRAAAPREALPPVDTSTWCQKRLCVSRTWLPDDPMVRRRSMQANFRRLGAVMTRQPSARLLVDMARELICEFAYYERKHDAGADERALLADALRLLEQGDRMFPRSLAVRFLYVRTLWHHGDSGQRLQALQLAADTVDADPTTWQLAPDDDVMPFDFHADCFNYRDCFDHLAAAAKGAPVRSHALVRLVLAAIAGYVARQTDTPSWHERVVALDPGFARYRLDLARCLLRRGDAGQRERGRQLLRELADGSCEFAAASRDLRDLRDHGAVPTAAVAVALRRFEEDTLDAELRTSALFGIERRETRLAAATEPTPAAPACRLAVLVPACGTGRELAELLTDLDLQTTARSLEFVLGVAADEPDVRPWIPESLRDRCRCVMLPARTAWAVRLNACVSATSAPFVTVALPGDRFRGDALELLLHELEPHPEAGVAIGVEGWTAGEVPRFHAPLCAGFGSAPPYVLRHLGRTNAIGMHAMWRRALHERFGLFVPEHGAAVEYEFWLRVAPHTRCRQSPRLLVSSCLGAAWRCWRDAGADVAAARRAQRAHGAAAGIEFTPARILPAVLLAPGIREEAESQTRLGILDEAARQELTSLEGFHGTALLHGDFATAACLLRAAADSAPTLIAPHLALADLLEVQGEDPRPALRRAAQCRPQAELVARRMARAEAAAAKTIDPSTKPTEPEPCPA